MTNIQPIKLNNTNIIKPLKSDNPSLTNNVETERKFAKLSVANLMAYTISFGSKSSDFAVFTDNIVKPQEGKKYQGAGIYTPKANGTPSDFIDWENKVGWGHLKKEPIDWKTATKEDIQSYWYSLALAEPNDSTWPTRFNAENVKQPLFLYRHIISPKAKEGFAQNITELNELQKNQKEILQLLDTPVVNKDGALNFPFQVFDTETTGINMPVQHSQPYTYKEETGDAKNPKPSKIIQIGAVKFDETGKIDSKTLLSQLIDPEVAIPEAATDVHGIKDEDVKGKPTMAEVLRKFEHNYLGKDIIVAYNSKFDISLLNYSIWKFNQYHSQTQQLDQRKRSLVIDPLTLICRIHPYLGAKKKLGERSNFLFCRDMEGAHDAFADVRGTADVLKYCLYYLDKKAKENGTTLTLRDVLAFQNGWAKPEKRNIGMRLDTRGLMPKNHLQHLMAGMLK